MPWPSCNPAPLITRLAPSPTGELHLGNVWSFLLCWLSARARGGKVLLRMDDIDIRRCKTSFAESIIDTLEWLGLEWDGEPIYQGSCFARYKEALGYLDARGLVYPCFCTRHDLKLLASAPHNDDAGVPYPGTCSRLDARQCAKLIERGQRYSLRMRCPEENIDFLDDVQGKQRYAKEGHGGDFPLKRSDGIWSYQLASAINDMDSNINLVVRGRDLLPSTARQIIIHNAFGKALPKFAHVPLLLNNHGERLAKRHASLSIPQLRKQGIASGRIIGQLAKIANLNPSGQDASPRELVSIFDWNSVPVNDIAINVICESEKAFAIEPCPTGRIELQ